VVITDPEGRVLHESAEGIGVATNNVAEYRAALEALRRAHDLGGDELLLRSDSKLLIEQLSGRWRIKNPTLVRLHIEARDLIRRFRSVSFEHVRRELNRDADRLANVGVDNWLAGPGKDYVRPAPTPDLFE
jgi:ribonuclease H / adenosylcobalamin/alpha-ribazole phosphatase